MIPSVIRVNRSFIGRYLDRILHSNGPTFCCCLECPPCSGTPVNYYEVASNGWTDENCTECQDWNANFILDLNGPGGCQCAYTYAEPIKCTGLPASNTDAVYLKFSDNGVSGFIDVGFTHNTLIACTDGACSYHFTKWVPLPMDCATIDTVVPLSSTGCPFSPQCNPPASITLRAIPL